MRSSGNFFARERSSTDFPVPSESAVTLPRRNSLSVVILSVAKDLRLFFVTSGLRSSARFASPLSLVILSVTKDLRLFFVTSVLAVIRPESESRSLGIESFCAICRKRRVLCDRHSYFAVSDPSRVFDGSGLHDVVVPIERFRFG